MGYMVNKFEHVRGRAPCTGQWGPTQREAWAGALTDRQNDKQTDMAENITFPQLHWQAVKIELA